MSLELANAILAADMYAQYDTCAKRLIGNKNIVAHILAETVDKFKGMTPEEIVPLIEDDVRISEVSTEPGLTNEKSENKQNMTNENSKNPQDRSHHKTKSKITNSPKSRMKSRLRGLNTENTEINEGTILFDILAYVRTRKGRAKVLVNIEIQKDEPNEYRILNRSTFYTCRIVSSEKERDFGGTAYDDIVNVYSIWICMNMKENTLNHIHMADEKIIGYKDWKGNLDIMNIIMIGLSEEIPAYCEDYRMHRLLGVLLSDTMPKQQKLKILKDEYKIPLEDEIEERVNIMCNLSQGIMEKGIKNGRAMGIIEMSLDFGVKKDYIVEMLQKKLDISSEEAQDYYDLYSKTQM